MFSAASFVNRALVLLLPHHKGKLCLNDFAETHKGHCDLVASGIAGGVRAAIVANNKPCGSPLYSGISPTGYKSTIIEFAQVSRCGRASHVLPQHCHQFLTGDIASGGRPIKDIVI